MNTIRVSATKARNTFFELLDKVAAGASVIVEKDAKVVAEIIPRNQFDKKSLLKAMRASRGILKNYDPKKDNPLRRPGAWPRLGKWDKGL